MSNDIVEKAKANHRKIMDKFEKAGGTFLFYDANKIKNDKFKPFLIATTEDNITTQLNKKINENPEKYKKIKLARVNIKGLEKNIGKDDYLIGIGGALGISLMFFSINEFNVINHTSKDQSATFWYTDELLAKKGLSNNDIKNAIKVTLPGNLSRNPFAVHYIHKFEEYTKLNKKKMNNDIIENARANYTKVMNKFNKARFLFYNANDVDNESFKPIVIGLSEDEIKRKMNEKIKKNPEKYKKYKLVRVSLLGLIKNIGQTEYQIGIGGGLGISVMVYSINEFNRIIQSSNDPYATFWYTDELLAKKGLSVSHIKKAIKLVLKGVLSSNPFKVYYVHKFSEYNKLKKKNKN